MTHLIEILLIVSIITSVIMLMLLIILKVGVTVTSRPLTKEEFEKLENRKWPWKRKPKVEDSSESTMSTESSETAIEPKNVVESYAEKEQTAIKNLVDTISKDVGIDAKCSFYRKRFLKCKSTPNRSHVYIDRENLDLIRSLLPIIDPKATISGFVSNIVADHLDRYKPEIIKMYNDERSKIM